MRTDSIVVGLLILLGLCLGPSGADADTPYNPERKNTLRIIPDTAPLPYLAARDHLGIGDTETALEKSEVAARTFPFHRPSFVLYFRLLSQRRGDSRAREWARKQLLKTKYTDLLNSLLESKTVDKTTLVPLLVWGVRQDFSTPETLRYLGSRLPGNQSDTDLESILASGLKTVESTPEMLELRVRLLARGGECDRAAELARRLVRRAPGRAEFHLLKARLLEERNTELANVAYDRYRSLLPDGSTAESLGDHSFPCPSSDD